MTGPDDPSAVPDDGGSPIAAPRPPVHLTVGGQARVVGTGALSLRLRSGPGGQYATIEFLPAATIVDVVAGPSTYWWQVRSQGQLGWASGYYLEPVDPPAPPAPPLSGHDFLLPYGAGSAYRVSQQHNLGSHTGYGAWAWDFGMVSGTPIVAASAGTVRLARGDSTVGGCSSAYANSANYVVIDRGDGEESLYLHLSQVFVTPGQPVGRGELIGRSGATGWACGAHLHFQIQESPTGGGTASWWNPSIPETFHDSGAPLDPTFNSSPVSANVAPSTGLTLDDVGPAEDVDRALTAGDHDEGDVDVVLRQVAR